MLESPNLTVGLIWHSEPEEILLKCLRSLNAALAEANNRAELVIIKTIWNVRAENHSENQVKVQTTQSITDSVSMGTKPHHFSSVQIIPVSPDQNSVGFKRNLILQRTKTELLYFTDPDVQHDQRMFVDFEIAMRNLNQRAVEISKQTKRRKSGVEQKQCMGFTGPYNHQSPSLILQTQIYLLTLLSARLGLAYQGVRLESVKSESENQVKEKWVDHAPMGHALFYADLLREIGGISPYFDRVGEDLDASHRAAAKGLRLLYCSARTKHYLPGFLKGLAKFFHYGRAQILVQSKNGLSYIRWHRLLPLTLLFPIFISFSFLIYVFPAVGFSSSIQGLSNLTRFFATTEKVNLILAVLASFFLVGLHLSVLGAYFWGMIFQIGFQLYDCAVARVDQFFEILNLRIQRKNESAPKISQQ